MKDFIEKWNSDSRFRTKTKLGLYTLFVVIVSVFALSTRGEITSNEKLDLNYQKEEKIEMIEIPDKYNYQINIKINENNYEYYGTKEEFKETITKVSNDINRKYIYQNSNYYKYENDQYILTTKEEIYDVVSYNYLNLETINQYLSKAIIDNKTYIVYLKDIILGHDSEKYITITVDDKRINIDYTSLMQLFNESIESHQIEIVIEEIE